VATIAPHPHGMSEPTIDGLIRASGRNYYYYYCYCYYDDFGGEHYLTGLRFCVLDGPLGDVFVSLRDA
jgi:hypothetical protein